MNRPVPDEVLLGLLKDHPTHGYDLLERFRSPSHLGRIWSMSSSQLYAVLKRLENDGAIIGKKIEITNAPDRIEYTVTETGEQLLETWINDPLPSSSIHRIRVMFLSRLYIANILGKPFNGITKHQKFVCELDKDNLQQERQQVTTTIEKLTLDFVIGQLDAAIGWLENIDQCHFVHNDRKSKKDQNPNYNVLDP